MQQCSTYDPRGYAVAAGLSGWLMTHWPQSRRFPRSCRHMHARVCTSEHDVNQSVVGSCGWTHPRNLQKPSLWHKCTLQWRIVIFLCNYFFLFQASLVCPGKTSAPTSGGSIGGATDTLFLHFSAVFGNKCGQTVGWRPLRSWRSATYILDPPLCTLPGTGRSSVTRNSWSLPQANGNCFSKIMLVTKLFIQVFVQMYIHIYIACAGFA